MQDAIVKKIMEHLRTPVNTESKAVYLLCELRKLMDKSVPDPPLSALTLYCNWALHVDLDRRGTTVHFLERVDEVVYNYLCVPETPESLAQQHSLLREFVYLETLRNELRTFLGSHHIPTELCDHDDQWFGFLAAYGGVIDDGSLSCEGKPSARLRLVEKVTFTKVAPVMAGGHVPFDIKWDVLLKDKRRLEVTVGTRPDDHRLMHWGIHLLV